MDKYKEQIDSEVHAASDSPQEILRTIHAATFNETYSENGRLTTTMARFSTLLVRLADDAQKNHKKIKVLTCVIIALTSVLAVLTALMAFKIWCNLIYLILTLRGKSRKAVWNKSIGLRVIRNIGN